MSTPGRTAYVHSPGHCIHSMDHGHKEWTWTSPGLRPHSGYPPSQKREALSCLSVSVTASIAVPRRHFRRPAFAGTQFFAVPKAATRAVSSFFFLRMSFFLKTRKPTAPERIRHTPLVAAKYNRQNRTENPHSRWGVRHSSTNTHTPWATPGTLRRRDPGYRS